MATTRASEQRSMRPATGTTTRSDDAWGQRRAALGALHRHRTEAFAAALVNIGIAGVVTGLLLPRGPVTTAQSVAVLTLCLALGIAAGLVTASRWAMLLGPAAFLVGFEGARASASGPTVDGLHLESIYGVMALVVGRGFDALVMLFPLAVGSVWGAGAGRRLGRGGLPAPRTVGLPLRRAGAILGAVLVVVLAAALLRPATTPPILAADGSPSQTSVADLATVEIGGHQQSIMIRGADRDAPVMLFLEGGPGGSAVGAMRVSGEGLERDFVLAVWDQRGTGKSIAALEPLSTLTLEQMVQDTLDVTDYLRQRFGKERIYLVGSSWGSTLGVLAVQRAPEKFHAFVGTGQMVDQRETDKRMYAESIAWAERTGKTDFARRLRDNGPPPYDDMLRYPDALSTNSDYRDFPHGDDYDPAGAYPASFFVPEYTFTEQVRGIGGIIDTFAVLYPQLQDTDFRRDVPALTVPLFIVEGTHESPGRADLAREWFGQVTAPQKQFVVFEKSGHTPHLDEPGRFHRFMVDTVLARTAGAS